MAKRDGVKNAAQSFFNEEQEQEQKVTVAEKETKIHENPAPAPKGYKVNPVYIEVKSERVQFVFQPSLLKEAKAEAKRRKTSLNELMHIALREFLEKE